MLETNLESYTVARDRFLKPNGLMYPTTGSIVLCPYTDETLYREQLSKIQFWENNNFYGINLTPAVELAFDEYFSQPVVGYFQPSCLISNLRTVHTIDFLSVSCEELQNFEINFSFRIDKTCIMHGLGGWFDIAFLGSQEHIVLSTSPESVGTHWYQCRLMLKEPIAVNKGQQVSGKLVFTANEKFSYNIQMICRLDGTEISATNSIRLHDQVSSSQVYLICPINIY
jgi:histone-arginine methyltransferase CARM1